MPYFVPNCGLITTSQIFYKDCFKIFPIIANSIMFNAFRDLLCSKLCWQNRPGHWRKFNQEGAKAVLVVPVKKSQLWYSTML